jgi:hypothetical protein
MRELYLHGEEESWPGAGMPATGDILYRLDRRTTYNRSPISINEHGGWLKPGWRARVRHWTREHVVWVGWSWSQPRVGRCGMPGHGKNREKNEERALRRSRRQVMALSLTLGVDRLWTLTYRENMKDKKRAWQDLMKFVRLVRKEIPGFKTVGVLERQERGAWHVHFGSGGYLDVNVMRRCWYEVVGLYEGKPNGQVDIAFKPDGKGNPWSKVATYISKYMTKDLSDRKLGERRYYVSDGIELPMEHVELEGLTDEERLREVEQISMARVGRLPDYIHVDGSIGFGWSTTEGEQ